MCPWWAMTADDFSRLLLAVAALGVMVRHWFTWKRVAWAGRRGSLLAWVPALVLLFGFSLAAAFNWWPLDVRRWLSQAVDWAVLVGIVVTQSAMLDTERNGH